jgi:dTDP-4-dehydrorhamnose 3,5-epimerase
MGITVTGMATVTGMEQEVITRINNMETTETLIKGLLIIQPKIFRDDRGYFYEPYNKKVLASLGIKDEFVQDNQSLSQKGVLRGLHFQKPPYAQAKLIRVLQGSVWDIALDIRKNSPTYGQYYGVELNEENKTTFYIPAGFAHGFVTLEDNTIFLYKCSDFYNKESEGCIQWNDPDINIQWNISNPILSEKDKNGTLLKNFTSPF